MLALLSPGKLKLAAYGVVAALVVGLYLWSDWLRDQNRELQRDVSSLEAAVEFQQAGVDAAIENAKHWKEQYEKVQRLQQEAERQHRAASAERDRLQGLFSRHDLSALAVAKPGLVEDRLNRGTVRVFRMLEHEASGDPDSAARAGAPTRAPSPTGPDTDVPEGRAVGGADAR